MLQFLITTAIFLGLLIFSLKKLRQFGFLKSLGRNGHNLLGDFETVLDKLTSILDKSNHGSSSRTDVNIPFGKLLKLGMINFELTDNAVKTTLQNSKLASLSRPKASRVIIGANHQKTEQTLGTNRDNVSDLPEEKFVAC